MQKLTAMQQKIYDYIANAVRTQGYPPSVREIGEAVGLKSPSTVHFHIKHLEELGYITKSGRKGRALTLTERESPAAIAAASPGAGGSGRSCAGAGGCGRRHADFGPGAYRRLYSL